MDLNTSLLMAIKRADAPRVSALLSAGADPNARADPATGKFSLFLRLRKNYEPGLCKTALMLAVESGDPTIIACLVANGANLDLLAEYGWSALTWAAHLGRYEMLRVLLKHGANVNLRNSDGDTPISWSVGLCDSRAVKVLLEHGADPNVADVHGLTPLMEAISHGQEPMVMMLLEAGANPKATTPDGKTMAEYARAERGKYGGSSEIVDLIARYTELDEHQ